MNTEMERRIVAMYFDNKDFEKNAKKTIDTLGELKDNLNLEDAVRGFDELNRAGKKLNLEDAKNSVRTLKDSLSGLKGAFQKALDIGTAPLRALDRFFDTFRGYVTKFAGYDMAWKFVQNFENAIRQLTIAPIEAGWNMYQQNIDSTRTIMSGTMTSYKETMMAANADWTYNEAEHMAFVKENLRELSTYAQQTVFSLTDMTSSVGKFTNNNVDLETAVVSMEGIANMTAKAGQGAQQASMAMYNFSQALGVGKMTSLDWRSIENANIATTELKNLFIQTAEAAGHLEKVVSKDSTGREIEQWFITVDRNGKKLAKKDWIEVSAENFRDTLSHGWLDKETMLRVFQLYSGKVNDIDTLAAWGFDTSDEELVNYLFGIGTSAMEAATQVRTFQKMWDAMTEAVQSGWAESMEWIFGDMQEATVFWSTVNDKIGEVLDRASKNRNDLLRVWRGYTYNENTGEWERLEGAVDGREDLIQGIYGVIDAAKDLGGAFSSAWSSVFGSMTGEKLQSITRGFREFIDKFRGWLGNLDDTGSRISKIRNGLSGVFNILKIGWTILKGVFNLGIKMIKPLLDPLLSFFGKFGDLMNLDGAKNLGDMLRTLRDRFSELWNGLKSLGWEGVFGKIGEALGHLWDIIWGGISDFLDDSGLSGVKEWLISIGGYLQEGYQAVKSWWEGSGIPEFFQGIWNAIVDAFMPRKYDDRGFELNEPGDSPIVAFFKNAWEGIRGFFEEVRGWQIWKDIGGFFSGVWNTIVGVFTPEKYDSRGFELNTPGDSPIVAFFKNTWEGVKGFFEEVQGWGIWGQIGSFFSGVWNTIVGIFSPEKYDSRGFELNTPGDSPIVAFFKNTWEGVKGFFEEVQGWGIWGQIGSFFSGVWNTIVGAFTPEEGMRYNGSMLESYTNDSPVVAFFKNTWEGVKGFFEEVQGWAIWGQIGSFFSGVWDTIMSVFTPQKQYDSRGFELNEPGDSPIVAFFKNTWGGISDFFGQVMEWEIWKDIGGFFTEVWGTISGWFGSDGAVAEMAEATGETADALVSTDVPSGSDTNERVGLLERIINAISGFIQQVMEAINGIVIPPEISSFLKNLGDILKGLFTFINNILGSLVRMSRGGGSDSEWIIAFVIGAIAIAQQVFSYLHTKNLASVTQAESFASKFMNLGLGLLAVAAALALLTTIDQGKMWSAVGALALMGVVMGVIIGLLNKNAKNNTELANAVAETPTERVLTRLIGAIEKIGMIAVALALLPAVIKAFGEAKQMAPDLEGADILETLLGLTTLIAGVSLTLGIVSKMTGGQGIDPLAALKTAISVIGVIGVVIGGILGAGGLLELVDGIVDRIAGSDVDTMGAIKGAIEKVKVVTDGIADLFNGFFSHLFGIKSDKERQSEAMDNLNALAEVSDRFDLETTSGILRIMEMMTHLTNLSEKIDTGKMTDFATAMENISLGILKFSWIIGGVDDIEGIGAADSERYQNFMGAIELVRQTADALSGFSSGGFAPLYARHFSDWANNPENLQDFVSGLNNVIDSLGGLHDGSNVNFDGIAIVNSMYEAIQTAMTDPDLPEFDATRIVDSIIKAIGLGETAIGFAVHAMVQAGMNASETGEDGQGYTFDATQFLGLMSGSTSGLGGLNDVTGQYMEALYGKGGSADNPSEDSLLGMFTGFSSKMEGIEFPDMSTKLTDAFSFKDPETGEDLDLVGSLQGTLNTFQEELNSGTEFEIKIVPTFDLSNLTEESLRTALGDYPVGLPLSFTMPESMKVDFTGLAEAIDVEGLKSLLGNLNSSILSGNSSIVTAIQQMEGRINSVASAIYNLKLYLDTGVLVGGITPLIDRELGRRANQASRTGVTSMLNNPYAYMLNSNQNQ